MKNVFIISGPAGSGKDAIINGLEKLIPLSRVITTTTRRPRHNETDGNPYHFLSREQFLQNIAEKKFIEYSVNENDELYGVTFEELDRVDRSGAIGIWKMDWKGVISAKKLFPNIIAIFIHAPMNILEARLRKRDSAQTNKNYFEDRMNYTKEWLKHTDIYDYTIENEQGELDQSIEQVASIIEDCTKKIV
ncbi:MAG: hypothetical protein PHH40_03710 [Candidatus Moranbacteria bacterium]|nr:hypothetical protein [Candidatus Moranbacteria bacterium]MDD3964645.1 hypothetical protein [Candidatus Moranbacteria bacterium]